ncbi:hypothetical protein, partial [Aeromicrobium massiliense]|uniref:hypothetical protein n=1 Tax=Aeromicrobium massiliense TaxID=1464554 RepID=UPI0005764DBB
EPRMTVSTQTTCDDLFDAPDGEETLFARAVAIGNAAGENSLDSSDLDELETVTDRLRTNASAAADDFRPYVIAMHDGVKEITDIVAGSGEGEVNLDAFKMGGKELGARCIEYFESLM